MYMNVRELLKIVLPDLHPNLVLLQKTEANDNLEKIESTNLKYNIITYIIHKDLLAICEPK